jgi:hypothetical protein
MPEEVHVRVVVDPDEEAEKGAIALGLDGGDPRLASSSFSICSVSPLSPSQ